MYNKPNIVFWHTVAETTDPIREVVQVLNDALATVSRFAARSGCVFHSLKTDGRKIRMYIRVNAHMARANIKRADSRFQDLQPQHDYNSDIGTSSAVPAIVEAMMSTDESNAALLEAEYADRTAGLNPDTPPARKPGRPRKNP